MNSRYGLAIQVSSSWAVKLMQPGPGGVRLAARFDALHHTACARPSIPLLVSASPIFVRW
jgi:hypothetical protein